MKDPYKYLLLARAGPGADLAGGAGIGPGIELAARLKGSASLGAAIARAGRALFTIRCKRTR